MADVIRNYREEEALRSALEAIQTGYAGEQAYLTAVPLLIKLAVQFSVADSISFC